MRRRLKIPAEVKESISNHIRKAIASAVDGYLSAYEDEDTLTGHLGASLRVNVQRVDVPMDQREAGGTWTWAVTYYKFRGRGLNASEHYLGADGIFELNLAWPYSTEKKSLLFQSKKEWNTVDGSLYEQSIKLSTWREAAFVLNYKPEGFEAFSLDDVIRAKGSRANTPEHIPLESFLSNEFLNCLIGDTDLVYDAPAHKLIWRAINGETVATRFVVGSRIAINVAAPKREGGVSGRGYRSIPNQEIYNYRLQADEEEILSLSPHYTNEDVKKAQRSLAAAYHPDKHTEMDDLLRDLLNRRMQEINNAADRVYSKLKKER